MNLDLKKIMSEGVLGRILNHIDLYGKDKITAPEMLKYYTNEVILVVVVYLLKELPLNFKSRPKLERLFLLMNYSSN